MSNTNHELDEMSKRMIDEEVMSPRSAPFISTVRRMSERKWTQGPWSYDPKINRVYSVSTNEIVAAPHVAGNPSSDAAWPADARLIAAAPQLYEALSDAIEGYAESAQHKCGYDNHGDRDAIATHTPTPRALHLGDRVIVERYDGEPGAGVIIGIDGESIWVRHDYPTETREGMHRSRVRHADASEDSDA